MALPKEIVRLTKLRELDLRENPIEELPHDLRKEIVRLMRGVLTSPAR